MSTLRSYTCSECGGILNYDKDQELFGCPFCGHDFAVGNIHRNELLKDAESRLLNLEFRAAREKIDSILEQYPTDPQALLYHILCEGRCHSVDDLESPDKMSSCDFVTMEQAAIEVQERCDVKDKAYFAKLLELVRTADKYNQLRSGVKAVPRVGKDQFRELAKAKESYKRSKENSMIVLFGSPGNMENDGSSGLLVVGGTIVLAVFFIGGKRAGFIALGIFAAVIAAFLLLTFLFRKAVYRFRSTPYKNTLDDLHSYEDSSTAEIKSIEGSYDAVLKRFKQLAPTAEISAPRSHAPKIPVILDKTIICNNCGGTLLVDSERQFYECKYCGVAYGSALFFGDPFAKALEAMSAGEYNEADQRFVHMLMLDPQDFNALLGRFLCCGKWKKLADLTVTQNIPQIRLQNLKERLDEIVSQASDEDREFFAALDKMIDDRIELNLTKDVRECNRLTAEFNSLRTELLREKRDLAFVAGIL